MYLVAESSVEPAKVVSLTTVTWFSYCSDDLIWEISASYIACGTSTIINCLSGTVKKPTSALNLLFSKALVAAVSKKFTSRSHVSVTMKPDGLVFILTGADPISRNI